MIRVRLRARRALTSRNGSFPSLRESAWLAEAWLWLRAVGTAVVFLLAWAVVVVVLALLFWTD